MLKHAFVVITVLILSCNNAEKNDPKEESAPAATESTEQNKANAAPDSSSADAAVFYAVCEEKLPAPSHSTLGWCGPKRSTNDAARADTTEHRKKYPGHSNSLSICSGSCPTCE